MGRPALHDTQTLLDVARTIAADRGPASVTIAAVSAASGAPSGSLYHRFDDRAALLGQLWLRTTGQFQSGFLAGTGLGARRRGLRRRRRLRHRRGAATTPPRRGSCSAAPTTSPLPTGRPDPPPRGRRPARAQQGASQARQPSSASPTHSTASSSPPSTSRWRSSGATSKPAPERRSHPTPAPWSSRRRAPCSARDEPREPFD